jgi:hypothetical protein
MNPRISVVVTVVDGGETLGRCLRSLTGQFDAPSLEILVPYDDTVDVPADLRREFDMVRFLELDRRPAPADPANPRFQHQAAQRRRAAGLVASTGELIGMIEDRVAPRAEWAATAVRLHEELPCGGIGGAIVNGCDRLLNWADFFSDYSSYQPPFRAGPRTALSDVNSCYKRTAFCRVKDIWQEQHYEPLVQRALLDAGETLFVSPELVVTHIRRDVKLSVLLRERAAWGRLYGEHRRETRRGRTTALAAVTAAVVPIVLFARIVKIQIVKRSCVWHFLTASPVVFLLGCAWAYGEASAYVRSGAFAPAAFGPRR